MDTNAILKQIAREIRYHTINDLIGRKIRFVRSGTIINDIRLALGNLLPNSSELYRSLNTGVIAKYGIIDLSFKVPSKVLKKDYRSGIPLLQELGFILPPEKLEEAIKFANESGMKSPEDPLCWSELAEEIAKGNTFLQLFMKGKAVFPPKYYSRVSTRKKTWNFIRNIYSGLKWISYFPQEFEIVDACYTNAWSVWLWKHFYL